jgi:hypothetical protein
VAGEKKERMEAGREISWTMSKARKSVRGRARGVKRRGGEAVEPGTDHSRTTIRWIIQAATSRKMWTSRRE